MECGTRARPPTTAPAGWRPTRPSATVAGNLWDYLERKYESYRLSGQMGIFETEHLCRWVHTVLPPIIKAETWEELARRRRPPTSSRLGVSLDPNGQRASAVLSWQQDDGRVAVRLIADVTGDPVDVPRVRGRPQATGAPTTRCQDVGYDGATDAELAKYFKKPEADQRGEVHQRVSQHVRQPRRGSHHRVGRRRRSRPTSSGPGARRTRQPGTWTAVKLSDDHPITAMLATIRAVWLASGPKPHKARVH